MLPVGRARWDRATARGGLVCAPLAGLVLGLVAGACLWIFVTLDTGPLLAAVLALATLAVLSRGLHLDGLADVADGFGSARPAAGALEVMKRSDIGPFGVLALVLNLLIQAAALTELAARGRGLAAVGVVLAALVSRAALTWSCRRGVPAARSEGLGAAVAETVPVGTAVAVAAAVAAFAAGAVAYADEPAGAGAVVGVCSVVLALSGVELLLRRCHHRFGGVTGDVLGAAAETAAAVTLLVLVVGTG
ncbi:adenosylcobinamide-GDP ribazoletransferase [Streptomyces sp. DSM 44917]|uniref:Adenosylcobinamide-GDP ribazoletransferase n=1 Tax=Streptomyces boetiae TaxID=3075541 RepID=A0ABU2LGL2_9ACTN|nr:adenosylcobinamide-GDP ribazoletransferase [Streptomyces sp. DSM 44917]MDT0310661.1 adenosylcobinamide-GDP ribazoletransferase [Streptomyces sp. DSM 44917]